MASATKRIDKGLILKALGEEAGADRMKKYLSATFLSAAMFFSGATQAMDICQSHRIFDFKPLRLGISCAPLRILNSQHCQSHHRLGNFFTVASGFKPKFPPKKDD